MWGRMSLIHLGNKGSYHETTHAMGYKCEVLAVELMLLELTSQLFDPLVDIAERDRQLYAYHLIAMMLEPAV